MESAGHGAGIAAIRDGGRGLAISLDVSLHIEKQPTSVLGGTKSNKTVFRWHGGTSVAPGIRARRLTNIARSHPRRPLNFLDNSLGLFFF